MTQEVKGGETEQVNLKVMAVKKENNWAVDWPAAPTPPPDSYRGFNKVQEAHEEYPWTPPLKSGPKAVDCWMAPVKPERSLLVEIVKEENSWKRVMIDCKKEKSKNSSKVDDFANCDDSPLRSCPKFDKMSDDAEEAHSMLGKIKNETMSNEKVVDEGDQLAQSPRKSCMTSVSADDSCKKARKTKVDFFGGELADDVEEKKDNILIIGSKYSFINLRCPLSGKLISELDDPVRSVNCGHVYDQAYAKAYINQFTGIRKCAVSGCPKSLIQNDLICDAALKEGIQDLRHIDSTNQMKRMMECIQLDDD